jgi:hypothetical protein
MATSNGPQASQMNKELASKSSLDLMLMQHPHDEDPNPQEVCVCLEVDSPRTWYYHISLNSHTLVILLQVDPVFGDELKTICEGYEI